MLKRDKSAIGCYCTWLDVCLFWGVMGDMVIWMLRKS